jgi:hypothetical protein
MGQSSNSLHFNSVSLVERVVQDSGSINYLPASVFIVGVTNEKVLSGESVGLDINVSVRHIVDERRLAHVGESSADKGTSVGVDLRETTQMLPDFLQIAERRFKFFHKGAHSTQSSSLKHFATVKRITVLQETHVIISDTISNGLGLVHVTQGKFVMVSVVEHVH